jgi:hypothetical protein
VKHRSFAATLVVVLGCAALARAQDAVDPDEPLPPGHPHVGAAPAGTEEDTNGEPMPAGHPGAQADAAPEDRASPAPDLRAGTIEVHLHDEKDRPLASAPVRLGIMKQDIAEGDSKSERAARTNAEGVALFEGLSTGTAYSYRVTANRDAGVFASEPLRLGETGGQRVLIHLFPVTRDIAKALVGMRGVLFVQPREDVFHIEASFQVINIGKDAWVPEGVKLTLPDGAKAFRPADSMSDTRVEKGPSGAIELLGTYGPGQHDVGYQFQLDNTHDVRRSIRVALPPHVAELRVVAEGARGMALSVGGFPDAEPMRGQDGSRLLVTGRRLGRGDSAVDAVEITLDNLPVPSAGRWYAVACAVLLAGIGISQTVRRKGSKDDAQADGVSPSEAEQAEELVLDELVALEKLRAQERIGPRTYEETRVELLDALARLGVRRLST